MVLPLSQQLFQILSRLWSNNTTKHLFTKFIQRWTFFFSLLKPWLTPEGPSGKLKRERVGKGTQSDRRAQNRKRGTKRSKTDPRSQQSNGLCADTISFSLYPSSHEKHTPSTQPAPPGLSTDTQSLQSAASDIPFTVQPQLSSSVNSGEAHIRVGQPADTSTHSDSCLGTEHGVFHDDHHLDTSRRPTTIPATPNSISRSGPPSTRTFRLRPAPSITSLHPREHVRRRASRLSSLLAHSSGPSRSHISIRSQIRATFSRGAFCEPEPDPLPIIEPQALPEEFSDPDKRIWTMYPEEVQRGSRRYSATKGQNDTTLEPLTMRFVAPWEPPGWEPIVHPEGQLYFWHEEKRVITEAYLYDQDTLHQVCRHLAKIEDFIERMRLPDILGRHDLVLDLSPIVRERGSYSCGYYFVNHEERSIFWLQTYPASALVGRAPDHGRKSKLHLKHEIEAQYWFHCHLFPTTLAVDLPLVAELRDIILHNIAGTMSFPTSGTFHSQDDLNKMLSWVNSLKKNMDIFYLGSACLVGRLMFIFARERFAHSHGEPGVRLNRGVSVYGTVHKRTMLIRTLSPLLFSTPLQNLISLERIWVDGLIYEPTCKVLINKLNNQWQELILFATLMLNANVAFLAIQSIGQVTAPLRRRPDQIASYVSVVASVGSIIIGLLLIKMNRVRLQDTMPDAIRFLSARSSKSLGLEILAIMYSLPFALLMWGMIAFAVAFCLNCFQDTTPATRGVVGAACLLVTILVIWCIWVGWDKSIHQEPDAIEEMWASPENDMNAVDSGEENRSNEKEDQGKGTAAESQPSRRSVDTPSPRRRIGSPHDLQIDADDTPSREEGTEYKGVWDRLEQRWRSVWSGQHNIGFRWARPQGVSEGSGTTAAAVV
ncbi:hypothetical protein P691DRAFT_780107 [Macrolepiota fuliginosa MF-IS2]|uniref:WW domain-containing protein n=1 Tax=Macrolepiota fuliginosa MF-IS2 TaxID=1400762 RepID=A0A9P6BW26_9AGAR|nr:hypothetical protein P691DRAFT_780107 [Macrolepiota fuliginosa MF-IS2]